MQLCSLLFALRISEMERFREVPRSLLITRLGAALYSGYLELDIHAFGCRKPVGGQGVPLSRQRQRCWWKFYLVSVTPDRLVTVTGLPPCEGQIIGIPIFRANMKV